jgi:hypothetical protein
MKKLIILCFLAINTIAGSSCSKDKTSDNGNDIDTATPGGQQVPEELIAPNGHFWTKGVISSINYHDNNSSEYRNAGGLFIFFKFNRNGTYKFMMYWNQSTAATRNQTWTEVEGRFEIGEAVLSDGKTYKTFKLKPQKGTERFTTDSRNVSRPLTAQDLATRGNLSGTFAFSRYTQNNRQFLDILNMSNNEQDTLYEEK